ncbi:hypothetical protein ACN9MY_00415 [Pseudoduganella sp. R-31]|uniref:hypothetical protein n=1 Tax=Pseudoduganella sp. R-31 TaxID=3404060 RepID=UPI003CF88398
MSCERESIQRQVALVSHGSAFLRKKLALEDWYQHGIFFGARLQFRDRSGNALLADDFPLWLATLAQAGATRLSLHPATGLGIAALPAMDWSRHVVAVHFPDRYQLWAVGKERAAWNDGSQRVPSAASHAGDVDCYLYLEERPGVLEVPHTDWKKLAAEIAADLAAPVPSDAVPAAPFCAETRASAEWARMPLFVAHGADSLAHRVLATLVHKQGKFANDTNSKNENSSYHYMDEAGAAAMRHWGERLDSWVAEVLLRAANIGSATATQHAGARLLQPPPALEQAPVAPSARAAPLNLAPVGAAQPPAEGKWTRRIGLAAAIAVLSVLVVAVSHIIVRFPWLAMLVGLPLALMRQKK